jgi:polysaccharide biosynthesis transport protein
MTQEGKYTSLYKKRGNAEKLAPKPSTPEAQEPAVVPAAPAATKQAPMPGPTLTPPSQAPKVASIQRVTGRMATPEYGAIMLTDRAGEAASQVRALRAKLLALNEGHPPRVITITSGSRDEGKTTMACNLAVALSEIEPGRVVLLDGDVLRPNIHHVMNLSATTGLNDILHSSDLSLDGNVYETHLHNLDIIPSRPITPEDEDEKLLHRVCEPLIQKLKHYYAFIIIDTPPVLAGSQACALSKHSDGAVVVAKLEKTPRQVVQRATDELRTAGAKVVGCILTHHKHHVPNLIYRFLGTTPSRYYRYGQGAEARGPVPSDKG